MTSHPPVHRGDHVRIDHLANGDPHLSVGDIYVVIDDDPHGDAACLAHPCGAALVAAIGDEWTVVTPARWLDIATEVAHEVTAA